MDHQIVKWAHQYAEVIDDRPSLNHARDFLLKGLREDIETYLEVHDEPEYAALFLSEIRASLEALQLVANGLNRTRA